MEIEKLKTVMDKFNIFSKKMKAELIEMAKNGQDVAAHIKALASNIRKELNDTDESMAKNAADILGHSMEFTKGMAEEAVDISGNVINMLSATTEFATSPEVLSTVTTVINITGSALNLDELSAAGDMFEKIDHIIDHI